MPKIQKQSRISTFFISQNKKRKTLENVQNTVGKSRRLEKKPKEDKIDGIGKSWHNALKEEFQKDYYIKLQEFLHEQRIKNTIFPHPEDVFSWTHHFPIHSTKVVIIGQDPYHGEGQAHGLCFSVKQPIKAPPSLKNIFKELITDVDGFILPTHGDLTGWAKQGVLLLNAVLTVQSGKANSHKNQGWETFTDAVVNYININLTNVVFLLWGAYAQKKGKDIDTEVHHVLSSVHPSGLSAHRGFFGCKHFSQTNQLLIEAGKEPIDWNDLD